MKRHVNIPAIEHAQRFVTKHNARLLPPLILLGSGLSAATTMLVLDRQWTAAILFAVPAIALIIIIVRMTNSATGTRLTVIGRILWVYALFLAIEIVKARIDDTWSNKTTAMTALAFLSSTLGAALDRGLSSD